MGLMNLTLAHEMICTCCGQAYKEEKRLSIQAQVDLFGKTKYAVCLRCLQKVDDETLKDPTYRRKVDRLIKNKISHLRFQERQKKNKDKK